MALEFPDIWTLSGLVLALLAIGLAMTSVPSPGHWEFRISRICFVGAALLFLAKLAFWGAEDLSLVRLGIVAALGAAIAVGLAYAIQWVNRKESPAKETKLQSASLLFNCQPTKLPTIIPPSGQLNTMNITSKLEFGGQAMLLGTSLGEPGEKLTWFEDMEMSVSRCDITNYADFPIFNIAMTFREEFHEAVPSKENPSSTGVGAVVETYDRPVIITNIDPKGTFSFYAYSQSRRYYIHVSLPSEVTYLKAGSDTRETAQLLPHGVGGGGMSFWPARIKESSAAPAAKSPPEPPPQAPSPPNQQGKK